jgi:hypothetical protein
MTMEEREAILSKNIELLEIINNSYEKVLEEIKKLPNNNCNNTIVNDVSIKSLLLSNTIFLQKKSKRNRRYSFKTSNRTKGTESSIYNDKKNILKGNL